MNRYFIKLAYNGAPFHGWQIQPNGRSVQQELENVFSLLLHETISITGCGRTDTGVHASDFYAHFDSAQQFSEQELQNLTHKLNSFLCKEIVIYKILPVVPTAHARFDAIKRTYQYHLSIQKLPFQYQFSHQIFCRPNIDLMNEAAQKLFLYNDFSCFSKAHTQTKTNLCTIFHAHWDWVGDELIFTISANRFLRNMVRAITGTLLDVGRGKISIDDFEKIIQSKNRCDAGTSMPAHALFLTKVEYEDGIL